MSREPPLVVVFEMVHRAIGGVQEVTASVLGELTGEFRIVVLDPYAHPDFAATVRERGLEVVWLGPPPSRRYVGGKGTPLRFFYLLQRAPWFLMTMWRVWRWVGRERPDVVYFNQLPALRVFGRLIARRGAGLVYHEHGLRSADELGRRTARFLSRHFACVLTVSKKMARFLVEAGTDPTKVRVVYNAVNAERIREKSQEGGGPLPDKPPGTVVFVHIAAVMRNKKAQHLGIEALGRLPGGAAAHLWICGDVPDGGEPEYLQELKRRATELGLQERVHFLGWRSDVPCVVKASDVCILPSTDHSESFGMVLAESMAQSKPCIGSNMGGIPEVIEDGVTGIVCEPTAVGLSAAMARMLESDDIRRSMGEAGRRRVESLFSLPRQVAEVAEAFRCAMADKKGARGNGEEPRRRAGPRTT